MEKVTMTSNSDTSGINEHPIKIGLINMGCESDFDKRLAADTLPVNVEMIETSSFDKHDLMPLDVLYVVLPDSTCHVSFYEAMGVLSAVKMVFVITPYHRDIALICKRVPATFTVYPVNTVDSESDESRLLLSFVKLHSQTLMHMIETPGMINIDFLDFVTCHKLGKVGYLHRIDTDNLLSVRKKVVDTLEKINIPQFVPTAMLVFIEHQDELTLSKYMGISDVLSASMPDDCKMLFGTALSTNKKQEMLSIIHIYDDV